MMVRHAGAAGWREMVTSPETAVSEMEMAMKVEELNMEPRELMLDELDDASGGFIVPLCVGAFIARSTCGLVGKSGTWDKAESVLREVGKPLSFSDRRVRRLACGQLAAWHRAAKPAFPMAFDPTRRFQVRRFMTVL